MDWRSLSVDTKNTAAKHPAPVFNTVNLHQPQAEAHKYVEVLTNRLWTRVDLDRLLWVDMHHNAVQLHTDAGVLRTYIPFDTFMEALDGQTQFLSCYKRCVANMNRISAVESDGFLMDNGDRVPIRKKDSSHIKQAYIQFICGSKA